ncbi:hypothetical protein [Paenibacillus sp. YPG26]|uniref:hypothetical protein n=1 Tax=Paenibacillus sp. YPG26 TaxID=2878915 RepID=UPI00203E623E|nr:hypothetical protein [Paenibacillus sp. YPG26]USB31814.1 hypothetical protein LDO05_10675 [Paenibacillus sp. YPG26]
MFKSLEGKEVTIHFIDNTSVTGGTIQEVDDHGVKYRDEFQILYIPISSIKSVALNTKDRQRPRVGFSL